MSVEPQVAFTPTRITCYNVFHGPRSPRLDLASWNIVPEGKSKQLGKMSDRAQKKIRSCVEWMCYLSKKRWVQPDGGDRAFQFRIGFISLTLPSPQVHSDNEIKNRCLNQFLVELRKKFGVNNYVWKAELQKNKNIHFHITIDKYIHYRSLRTIWNRIVNKLGYVDKYRNKMLSMSYEDYHQMRNEKTSCSKSESARGWNFGQQTEWVSPNSVDVRSVKDIKDMAAYMAKYLTKNPIEDEEDEEFKERVENFEGNLWYCSTSLSRLSSYKTHPSRKTMNFIDHLMKFKSTLYVVHDYCECIYFKYSKLKGRARESLDKVLFHYALSTGYILPCLVR